MYVCVAYYSRMETRDNFTVIAVPSYHSYMLPERVALIWHHRVRVMKEYWKFEVNASNKLTHKSVGQRREEQRSPEKSEV